MLPFAAIIELHDLGMSVPNRVQEILDKVVLRVGPHPFVRDNAVQADYILFNRAKYAASTYSKRNVEIGYWTRRSLDPTHRSTRASMNRIANHPLLQLPLLEISMSKTDRWRVLEALIRRMYAGRSCTWKQICF